MKAKLFLIALLMLIFPSTVFSQDEIKSGYDIYHNLKLMDNPATLDDAMSVARTIGYLDGCIDGISLTQDALFESMFPSNIMTEGERTKLSKQINFSRLNIPKEGIHVGQLILIFKKWAEKHPEKLNGTARICIWEALVESYGWK